MHDKCAAFWYNGIYARKETHCAGTAPARGERKDAMETYNVICPCCGHENRSLYLAETEGWLECSNCLTVMQVTVPECRTIRIEFPSGRAA